MIKTVRAGCFIDGVDKPKNNIQIDIEGKKIAKIKKINDKNNNSEERSIINAEQFTVLPGLIDTHIHLTMNPTYKKWDEWLKEKKEILLINASKNAEIMLSNGITTARDCGAYGDLIFLVREMIDNKLISGPRLIISGNPITITGGHCHYMGLEADSEAEIIKSIRLMKKLGVDFIKIMSTGGRLTPGSNPRKAQYNLEQMEVAVKEAHQRNMKIASHALGTEGIVNSVHAGVDTIIHLAFLDTDEGFDDCEDILSEIAEKGIFVEPTLPASALNFNSSSLAGNALFERRVKTVKKLNELGVKLIAGTDAGVPNINFIQLFHSISLLAKFVGISNYEAIQTATTNAACALGIDKYVGTLKEGKYADLLVVNGNPIEDLEYLKNIVMVIKEGDVVFQNIDLLNKFKLKKF